MSLFPQETVIFSRRGIIIQTLVVREFYIPIRDLLITKLLLGTSFIPTELEEFKKSTSKQKITPSKKQT